MGNPACIAALLALTLPLAAQRSPFFATVVGPDGNPLINAEVTCVFTPDQVTPLAADVVTAHTDTRGRARCNLLIGQIYSAWAVGKPDDNGASLVSRVVPLVAAGRVAVINAQDQRPHQQLEPTQLAAWHAVGATGVRWLPAADHDHHHDLPWPTDGTIHLPASPWTTGCLALTDKNGQVMVTAKIEPEQKAPPTFAPPIKLTAVVKDDERAPVVGAQIVYNLPRYGPSKGLLKSGWRSPLLTRIAGRTDEDGKLQLFAPEPKSTEFMGRTHTRSLIVRAIHDGYQPTPEAVDEAGTVRFKMPKVDNTSIRLLGPDADNIELHGSGSFMLRTSSRTMMFGTTKAPMQRQSNGAWTAPILERGLALRALLVGKRPTAIVIDHLPALAEQTTIDLREHEVVDVRVLDAAGGPTACAIGIARVGEGTPIYWQAALATDLAGAAQLRLPGNGDFYVYATTGSSHAMELVTLPASGPLTLQLEALPTMQLRVLDEDGKPVAGAHVHGLSSRYHSPSKDARGRQWDRLAHQLHSSYSRMARSDRNGVMQIPTFVRQGLTVSINVERGEQKSQPLDLSPGAKGDVRLVQ